MSIERLFVSFERSSCVSWGRCGTRAWKRVGYHDLLSECVRVRLNFMMMFHHLHVEFFDNRTVIFFAANEIVIQPALVIQPVVLFRFSAASLGRTSEKGSFP